MTGTRVVVALLLSGCASTATRSAAAPAVLTDAPGRRYKVVCQMERSTGSNIAEKVCHTEPEDREDIRRLQDQLMAPTSRPRGLPSN